MNIYLNGLNNTTAKRSNVYRMTVAFTTFDPYGVAQQREHPISTNIQSLRD